MNYVGRVNKLDALQLDAAICQIIREQNVNLTRDGLFVHLIDFQKQIDLLTNSAIWWYSFKKHHATLGQQLLALKYDENQVDQRRSLVWHWIFQVGLPSFYQVGDSGNKIIQWMENFYILAKIWIFFKFCHNGKRPSLTDSWLGLDLHSTEIKRTVSYGYMNRELIWNGFIEFLVYTIPMINFQIFRNRFRRLVYGKVNTQLSSKVPIFTTETLCIYCHERPTLPHHIGCGHVYCYFCLKGNFQADPKNFSCVECGAVGKMEKLGLD